MSKADLRAVEVANQMVANDPRFAVTTKEIRGATLKVFENGVLFRFLRVFEQPAHLAPLQYEKQEACVPCFIQQSSQLWFYIVSGQNILNIFTEYHAS